MKYIGLIYVPTSYLYIELRRINYWKSLLKIKIDNNIIMSISYGKTWLTY